MKKLTLVRHGKSSWDYNVPDIERPLTNRGIKDALLVAQAFSKKENTPEVFFSSPANRALSTCKIFINQFKVLENTIKIDHNLYDFEGNQVISFIKNLPNTMHSVMIFGHNHAFTSITNIYGDRYIDNLPTCGLVNFHFDIADWTSLKPGITNRMIIPKAIKND